MLSVRAGSQLSGAVRAVLDLVLPRECVVCGSTLTLKERHICLSCMAGFPFTHYWELSRNPMADRFNALIRQELDSERIGESSSPPGRDAASVAREPYAYAAALFFYDSESPYRNIPLRLKYGGGIRCGEYFGEMLGRRLAGAVHFRDVDLIVPVPLHWTRKWRRGYNQAGAVARGIAGGMGESLIESLAEGAQVRTDLLRRKRRTRTQTRLSGAEKAVNVRGAFAPTRSARAFLSSISPAPRHILLVDDTFTTGSTLFACMEALRQLFPPPVRISVASLAFVL